MIGRLNHVAIAVPSVDIASEKYTNEISENNELP